MQESKQDGKRMNEARQLFSRGQNVESSSKQNLNLYFMTYLHHMQFLPFPKNVKNSEEESLLPFSHFVPTFVFVIAFFRQIQRISMIVAAC